MTDISSMTTEAFASLVSTIRKDGFDPFPELRGTHKRALIGGRMLLDSDREITPAIGMHEVVDLVRANHDTIRDAKIVLACGTPAEVSDLEHAVAGVDSIASRIKKRVPKDKLPKTPAHVARKIISRRAPERKASHELFDVLRTAVVNLAVMPSAADMVKIARTYDRSLMSDNLEQATLWLMEFSDGWQKARAGRNGDGDGGNGGATPGAQSTEPPAPG